mmetsp:Transcript_16720/g.27659  ORF Transcript_16720/g.27659 Transcript_16720/m.27659 type:complete len:116 (-) Transcript_16720:132-479(-)
MSYGGIKFCRECNNMLYPKEDKERKILLFACRNCEHQEVADDPCVYRNDIVQPVDPRTTVIADLSADPTLPRTKDVRCAKCDHREAVYITSVSKRADEGMKQFFICTACKYRWKE